MNDDPLITRIHAGDQDALVEFLNVARPRLLGYINTQLGPGLRTKIEPDPRSPVYVETVYGMGYRFAVRRQAG